MHSVNQQFSQKSCVCVLSVRRSTHSAVVFQIITFCVPHPCHGVLPSVTTQTIKSLFSKCPIQDPVALMWDGETLSKWASWPFTTSGLSITAKVGAGMMLSSSMTRGQSAHFVILMACHGKLGGRHARFNTV